MKEWSSSEGLTTGCTQTIPEIDANVVFAAFVLLAVSCEFDESNAEREIKKMSECSNTLLSILGRSLHARFDSTSDSAAVIAHMNLTDEQRTLCLNWLERKVEFVSHS